MCYNVVMVRSIHKTNILYASLIALFITASSALPVSAEGAGVDLGVNIGEILSVTVDTPAAWAQGNVDTVNGSALLRNKVTLTVASNNEAGFKASMFSKTTTDLVNKTKATATIPTLNTSTTAASFPVNAWGYSTNDADAGLTGANYSAMETSPIAIANPTSPASLSQDIFFGARADATKDSGTYANTVVFTVVSGVITEDPENPENPGTDTPTDPNTPGIIDDNNSSNRPIGGNAIATTTGDEKTDDTISNGNITNSYADPYGVTKTSIGTGTPLATGLAVTAGVAATTGFIFFIIAKRKKDEEEDDEELNS